MKIEIIIKEAPMFTSYTIGGKSFDLNKLKIEKVITIEACRVGKTRVNTTIQQGQFRATFNWLIPGFRLDAKKTRSFMDYSENLVYYFKKSKVQDLELYKNYIKLLMHTLIVEQKKCSDMPDFTIELIPTAFL